MIDMISAPNKLPNHEKQYRKYWAWIPHTGAGIPDCNLRGAKFIDSYPLSDIAVNDAQEVFHIDFSLSPHRYHEKPWDYYKFNTLNNRQRPARSHVARIYVKDMCEPVCLLIGPGSIKKAPEKIKPDTLPKPPLSKTLETANPHQGAYQGVPPNQSSLQPIAGIKIDSIDQSSGIVSFTLYLSSQYLNQDKIINERNFNKLAEQLYRILRQCYHRHVWTNGDLVVRPVSGVNTKHEAAKKMWDLYFDQRLFIDTVNDVKRSYFKTTNASERKWVAIRETCASGMGELVFAETLAKCTEPYYSAKLLDVCKRGRDSYDTIWRLITARQDGFSGAWSRWASIGQYMGVGATLLGIYWQYPDKDMFVFLLLSIVTIIIPGMILLLNLLSRSKN